MKKPLYIAALLLFSLNAAGNAQNIDTTDVLKMQPDSARVTAPPGDTTSIHTDADSLHATHAVTTADTGSTATGVAGLKLIKRSYNSRQQLLLASGMMIFIIAIMTLSQQFNPN